MGHENTSFGQPTDAPVDIASWKVDETFAVYPEGARDKGLLYSPDPSPYRFLVANHRYLFKRAFRRYPDQFWAEIIAYRIGSNLGVSIPPTFVAWHSGTGVCGALSEWFLAYPGKPIERYVPGGDILTSMFGDYDRKRGRQHNFEAIERYLTVMENNGTLKGCWRGWWCDTLLSDALIGNTDRHHDNWGLLWSTENSARMAPVFDNGTSLGHEIFPCKMPTFSDDKRLHDYMSRGCHHMRGHVRDERRISHEASIQYLLGRWPDMRGHIENRLAGFDDANIRSIITGMTQFVIPIPLSAARAEFVVRLTTARYRALIRTLTG